MFQNIIAKFRGRHYTAFRAVSDNKIVQKILISTFGRLNKRVRTPEGYHVYINPLYHSQFCSEDNIQTYEENLRRAFGLVLKEGMIVYDVGANVGIFSLLSAKSVGPDGMVYAFEPEEINYRRLRLTQKYNNIGNLKIETCCVDDISGTQFFDHRGGAFSGRLVDADALNQGHRFSQKQTITLDDYIFELENPLPDLVKIDVEGHEFKVINGMRKTLHQYHPILIIELHENLCDSIPDIFDLLSSEGYECLDLTDFISNEHEPLNSDSFCQTHYIFAKK